MKDQYVIIVAGGTGSRMNSSIPKQFIEVGGEPVIIKTIHCFNNYNPGIHIIIAVHVDFRLYLEELISRSDLNGKLIQITVGGLTRFDSVKNGLQLVNNDTAIVAIHDAARPFVSVQTIKNCFEAAETSGNAIPCIAIKESIRKLSGGSSHAINREEYMLVQTPQCFRVSEIKAAFQQPYKPSFTDDATVLEAAGGKIHHVEGNIENIKITSPLDLVIANALLKNDKR